MRDPIYCRIAGYLITISMHSINIWDVSSRFHSHKNNPEIWEFYQIQHLFLTNWNVALQICYATLGLTCDILTLTKNDENNMFLKKLRTFRDFTFAGLLFAPTMLVFTIFWSFYLYDPLLMVPPFIDQVLRPVNNHVVHTLIVPVVLWEVVFRPRTDPGVKAHAVNYGALVVYNVVYSGLLFYTHQVEGIWIYPYLEKADGSIYMPMSFIMCLVLITIFYAGQWRLSDAIWGKHGSVRKKIC